MFHFKFINIKTARGQIIPAIQITDVFDNTVLISAEMFTTAMKMHQYSNRIIGISPEQLVYNEVDSVRKLTFTFDQRIDYEIIIIDNGRSSATFSYEELHEVYKHC